MTSSTDHQNRRCFQHSETIFHNVFNAVFNRVSCHQTKDQGGRLHCPQSKEAERKEESVFNCGNIPGTFRDFIQKMNSEKTRRRSVLENRKSQMVSITLVEKPFRIPRPYGWVFVLTKSSPTRTQNLCMPTTKKATENGFQYTSDPSTIQKPRRLWRSAC